MRIANIIIAHKNPQQLGRLLRKMNHPDFHFYIHVDKKVNIDSFKYLGELDRVNFIQNRVVCNWGGYSTLEAMINSLAEVIAISTEFDFYNLLSAQDYPIKSNETIIKFLDQHRKNSFIFYESENAKEWWGSAVLRFQKYHLTDFNFYGNSFLEKVLNTVLPTRKFPFPLKLYGGSKSSWWTLNRISAIYLIDFVKNNKRKLDSFFRYCWGTDEFVIPTILMNSPMKETIINNNLRYIDFPDGKANPKVMSVQETTQLKVSNMLFARKFDPSIDSEILDKIDEFTSTS